jgi:hypothetical protein
MLECLSIRLRHGAKAGSSSRSGARGTGDFADAVKAVNKSASVQGKVLGRIRNSRFPVELPRWKIPPILIDTSFRGEDRRSGG